MTAAAGHDLAAFAAARPFLRHDNFRLLFLATFGSGIGNWLAVIALPVDVYDRTHSGWWVGALLIANILPAVFIGLLFGPLVDRLSRKGLMIASDLGRLAVFAALPFAELGRRDRRRSPSSPGSATRSSGRPSSPGCRTSSPRSELADGERAAPARRVDDDRARPAARRRRSSPRPARTSPTGVNAVTFALSAALVALDPGPAAAERPADRPRPLERPRARASRSFAARARSSACWSSGRSCMLASGSSTSPRSSSRSSRSTRATSASACSGPATGVGLVVGGLAAAPLIERDLGVGALPALAR